MADDRALQLCRRRNDLLPNDVILQVIPDPLIGIELWRVGRKQEQAKPLFDRLCVKEPGHRPGLVRGVSVHDQKDHAVTAMQQASDEVDKPGGAHGPFDGHKPKLSLGAHRGDDVQAEPRPGATDKRRVPFERPGGARMMVRAHPGLIAKEDLGLQALRQPLDLKWKLGTDP